MTWMFAALAIANVVLAAIVVIIVSQRPTPATTVTVQPASGGGGDVQTRELLGRLDQEQRELERKLADVQQLRTVVEQLSERVHRCEQADKHEPPGPRPRRDAPAPVELGTCDEVSCVLTNYEGPCCATLRATPRPKPPTSALPDTLDRATISAGIAAVRSRVAACEQPSTPKGKVKVRVRVSPAGSIDRVLVESTPDATLGACVASALRTAIFDPTQHGGSFSYPFVFGASP
jgi:hypothetical protein